MVQAARLGHEPSLRYLQQMAGNHAVQRMMEDHPDPVARGQPQPAGPKILRQRVEQSYCTGMFEIFIELREKDSYITETILSWRPTDDVRRAELVARLATTSTYEQLYFSLLELLEGASNQDRVREKVQGIVKDQNEVIDESVRKLLWPRKDPMKEYAHLFA